MIRAKSQGETAMALDDDARVELSELAAAGRLRGARVVDGVGPTISVDGREVINASSNDYLALAGEPSLKQAARSALEDGVGAGASRLITGNHRRIVELEQALVDWLPYEAARVFVSGYAANTGTLGALFGPGDVIFSDALNHASIVDGCRLSRAEVVVVPHLGLAALEVALRQHHGRRRVVVSETLFSMDGDVADVAALRAICDRFDASLMLDEAHAIGAYGPEGRGIAASTNIRADILVGTFGKALGVAGAFVATTANIAEVLWNRARPLVFSTAMAPVIAAAATAAIQLVRGSGGESRRAQLALNCRQLRTKTSRLQGAHAIAPLRIGDDLAAISASERVLAAGVLAMPIRPPTVPPNTARLRVSVSSGHTPEMIERIGAAVDGA